MRDDADFVRHVDYTRFDQVKQGLVVVGWDRPFPSFRRAVVRGDYRVDWRDGEVVGGAYGERPDG